MVEVVIEEFIAEKVRSGSVMRSAIEASRISGVWSMIYEGSCVKRRFQSVGEIKGSSCQVRADFEGKFQFFRLEKINLQISKVAFRREL